MSVESRYEQYPWWVLVLATLGGFLFGFAIGYVPVLSWAPIVLSIVGPLLVFFASLNGGSAQWSLPAAYYGRLIALFGLAGFLGMAILYLFGSTCLC